jgi:KamA family protein
MSKILKFYRKSYDFKKLAQEPKSFKAYGAANLDQIPQVQHLGEEQKFAIKVLAKVLPFRVNQYVLDELIDWTNIPNDPIFQLTFPQPGMLEACDFNRIADLLRSDADNFTLHAAVKDIRNRLNPHPGAQKTLNVPTINNIELEGIQHKYRETVLFFPGRGQTCHSYCTFCFRWAQFIGDKELKFSSNESEHLYQYLRIHKDVTDLLITGGDPMVMRASHLRQYLLPILERDFEHVQNIRIGTKSLSFWPYRFINDEDSEDLLDVLRELVRGGKHVAIMTHFNHWRELETPMAIEAIMRLRDTGVVLRSQSPLVKNINDDPNVWSKMWSNQTRIGIVPYYMFVERDTGARNYFEVPLYRTWQIYRDAIKQVSGLSRTVRGPSMSSTPGKV